MKRAQALARALAAFLWATLFLVLCPYVVHVTAVAPAFAGNGGDDARSDREEQRREREEAKRQREEARQQREAQREEARQQREAQREAQRAAQEEARRQREADKAQREAARAEAGRQREEQRATRNDTRDVSRDDGSSSQRETVKQQEPVTRPDSGSQRETVKQQESATQRDSGSQRDNSSNGSSTPRETARDTGKSDDGGGNSKDVSSKGRDGDTRKNDSESKSKDKAKDDTKDDTQDDAAVQPEEPKDEPPRTVADWWKRFTEDKATAVKTTAEQRSGDGNQVVVSPSPGLGSTQPKAVTITSKPLVSQTKQAAAAATQKSAASTYNGPKIKGFDAGLRDLGEFHKREIMASHLDKAAVSKAEAMGFKTIKTVRSPGAGSDPVRTLAIPSGVSERAAQHLLEQALPGGRFGPNHVFRIVPQAEDSSSKSYPAMHTPADVSAQCAGPDCFAEALIGWNKSLSSCADAVRIGVIDTSFDMSHPALKGRNFVPRDFRSKAMDFKEDWHGTAVLSVLAGEKSSATPGLVPGARFLLASTFVADGSGQASADAMSVLAALSWLDGQTDIVNMSFSGPRNEEIELAIRAMAAKGVIFVAAAGNGGPNGPPSYPAAYSDVIAVTAIGKNRQSYRHATHGDYIDIAAPGVDVYTALPLSQAGLRTGTSFAAPFVTGLIAAMPGARKGIENKSDLLQRISIKDLGAPGRDPTFGEGLPVAPSTCDEIGGIASLPWSPEGKRRAVQPVVEPDTSSVTGALATPASLSAGSAMGSAFGLAP